MLSVNSRDIKFDGNLRWLYLPSAPVSRCRFCINFGQKSELHDKTNGGSRYNCGLKVGPWEISFEQGWANYSEGRALWLLVSVPVPFAAW